MELISEDSNYEGVELEEFMPIAESDSSGITSAMQLIDVSAKIVIVTNSTNAIRLG